MESERSSAIREGGASSKAGAPDKVPQSLKFRAAKSALR